MVKHSPESQEFIRELRKKSQKNTGEIKTDARLVSNHQLNKGVGIFGSIIAIIIGFMMTENLASEHNYGLGTIVMALHSVLLIYGVRDYLKGRKFKTEWIAHWKKITKDTEKMSFDEINDMARWL